MRRAVIGSPLRPSITFIRNGRRNPWKNSCSLQSLWIVSLATLSRWTSSDSISLGAFLRGRLSQRTSAVGMSEHVRPMFVMSPLLHLATGIAFSALVKCEAVNNSSCEIHPSVTSTNYPEDDAAVSFRRNDDACPSNNHRRSSRHSRTTRRMTACSAGMYMRVRSITIMLKETLPHCPRILIG